MGNTGKGVKMNNKLNIAICDDDLNYIVELEKMIQECQYAPEVSFFRFISGEELLKTDVSNYHAIFLDIQMENGLDGNDVAVKINEMGYNGVLVQCSGIYLPTPETIKISPYRYLLKQDLHDKTIQELYEIKDEVLRRSRQGYIEAFYLREKIQILFSDIVYITHHQKGSVLKVRDDIARKYVEGNIIVPQNFKQLKKELPAGEFSMPHNSYIVNLKYVDWADIKDEVVYISGSRLSISRSKKDSFFLDFTKYSEKKYKGKLI